MHIVEKWHLGGYMGKRVVVLLWLLFTSMSAHAIDKKVNNVTIMRVGFMVDANSPGGGWGFIFTGHEQLEESGLVRMNGRFYDPVIGRFLSRLLEIWGES
ncbi:TPA: hypothetical protein L5E93_000086 [Pseudomonas aeruginosa]|nr:hypothetical protein [Pseudomonas aeruginosa]MBV5775697.1 hypothetical protein [Pseudomonas aeruginosa]MDC3803877.1 hypothetical protein [Pseudomonas aeruginosa]HBO7559272.1 hypothetical protein [Pseudomonas aeruginosa]HBO9294252.1 hypothetical protein [Pseudomonas aeruginosa]